MTITKNFIKVAALLVAIFYLGSCEEEEFNTVGSDLIPSENFDALLFDGTQMVTSQQDIVGVQTNGLPTYLLGVYNDEIYGQTSASVLTQLVMASANPTFGDNVELDSVVMSIPYFSTPTAAEGDTTFYSLDSIYGSGPIKLTVQESGYFLRNVDPNSGDGFSNAQLYYSNQQQEFENNLRDFVFFEDDNFEFSNEELVLKRLNEEDDDEDETNDTIVERVTPRLRVKLDSTYFKNNIIDKEGSEELLNNNNFKNFFRGLYFNAEAVNPNGSMALLNFGSTNANITLYYRSDLEESNGGTEGETTSDNTTKTFVLNFGDIIVNTYKTPFTPSQNNQNLYIKGATPNIAEIELFSDEDQLDSLKQLDWLVNEANLTFYVNQQLADNGEKEPERIFVYDLNNNTILFDYTIDFTQNATDPVNSRILHLGRLTRTQNESGSTTDEEETGIFYKIKMTEYVKNIIQNDSTNTRIGVAVSPNVEILGDLNAKTSNSSEDVTVPFTAPLSPEGTVLHSNLSPNEDKRLKLRIYYTEPN